MAIGVVVVALCLIGPRVAQADQLVVGFDDAVTPASQIARLRAAGADVDTALPRLDVVTVDVARADIAKLRERLAALGGVDYVARDGRVSASWVPNDPDLSQQWALATIGTASAWDTVRAAGAPVVAVVDSGVDYTHVDLAGQVILGLDYVDDDPDPMDVNGHGTHVSGIVAAVADNSRGIAGVAPGARILAIRVLDANGSGYLSDVAAGVLYATDHSARVINLSLGGPSGSQVLLDAIRYANSRGVVVTCAAGNESRTELGFPARYAECFSVGATTRSDTRASFSNTGPGLDITAPGVDIRSTTMGNGYANWSGTSMATPVVSGVAALLADAGQSQPAIETTLRQTAVDLGGQGLDLAYGAGRVDAATAIRTVSEARINNAPVCNAIAPVSTNQNVEITVGAVCTDSEQSAASLKYQVVTPAARGVVTVSGNVFRYTPLVNYSGPDSFSIRAVDSDGRPSEPRTVTVQIQAAVSDSTCLPLASLLMARGSLAAASVACIRKATCGAQVGAACPVTLNTPWAYRSIFTGAGNPVGTRATLHFSRRFGTTWRVRLTARARVTRGNTVQVVVADRRLTRGTWRVRATSAKTGTRQVTSTKFYYVRVR